MAWWWLIAAALAVPDGPRETWPVTPRTVTAIVGDGPARTRGWRGDITAWRFPDGYVEHFREGPASAPTRLVRFDADLRPHTVVTYESGSPNMVVVTAMPDQRVPVAGWTPHSLGAATFVLPAATVADDSLRADVAGGELRARWTTPDAVWAADWPDRLGHALGGLLEGSPPVWIDAHPARRVSLLLPGLTGTDALEVWAIPTGDALLLVSYRAPQGTAPASLDTLAPGRAAMALVTLQVSP